MANDHVTISISVNKPVCPLWDVLKGISYVLLSIKLEKKKNL